MKRWAVAGFLSACTLSIRAAPSAIFSSAEASHKGRPPKNIAKVASDGNRAGEGRRDGHDQRVAVFHMGQFMGHDTGDFLRREHAQKTGRHRHCRVFRIASGGKGVGLGIVDHIDLGRGQTSVARELVAPY